MKLASLLSLPPVEPLKLPELEFPELHHTQIIIVRQPKSSKILAKELQNTFSSLEINAHSQSPFATELVKTICASNLYVFQIAFHYLQRNSFLLDNQKKNETCYSTSITSSMK
jgi:hypothetical protein